MTAKGPVEKLAHRHLTLLELAEQLGNVNRASRRGGIDRTSFCEWKHRFQLHGFDGLKDLPPIARSNPITIPPEVVERTCVPWRGRAGALGHRLIKSEPYSQ